MADPTNQPAAIVRANQLDVDRAFVLVIDVQEKLLPMIRRHERVVEAGRKLLDASRIFNLPVIATEQYPKGIGPTEATIRRCLTESHARVLEKSTFSAWTEPTVREAIIGVDRPQAIVMGIEAHVCVQQSVLDLVSRDYDVFVCADAIGSRGKIDYKRALERMRQEGAWVTTVEGVLFELCHRCDTKQFKAMIEIIKASPAED